MSVECMWVLKASREFVRWLLWIPPQKENLGLAIQLCQVHELEEEEYYHPSAVRVIILPMRVSKMYWTFGRSHSVAALMATVFLQSGS